MPQTRNIPAAQWLHSSGKALRQLNTYELEQLRQRLMAEEMMLELSHLRFIAGLVDSGKLTDWPKQ